MKSLSQIAVDCFHPPFVIEYARILDGIIKSPDGSVFHTIIGDLYKRIEKLEGFVQNSELLLVEKLDQQEKLREALDKIVDLEAEKRGLCCRIQAYQDQLDAEERAEPLPPAVEAGYPPMIVEDAFGPANVFGEARAPSPGKVDFRQNIPRDLIRNTLCVAQNIVGRVQDSLCRASFDKNDASLDLGRVIGMLETVLQQSDPQ